jgi:hypothetical protein
VCVCVCPSSPVMNLAGEFVLIGECASCVARVEGRTWYTSHCGKLWIASTATAASPETICAVEEQYRQLYKGVVC